MELEPRTANMAYDAFAAKFTVSGSSISCLASLAVLLYCLASRARHPSLRHALVVNLCLASKHKSPAPPCLGHMVNIGDIPCSLSSANSVSLLTFSTDFLNTVTTTISGFTYVDIHQLYPGHACRANGFFALMTAQAVDFTILTIVLLTLLAVTRRVNIPTLSVRRKKLLICSTTWAIPFVTSLTALATGALRPVDLNWCDITATRPDLQYALVRSWRLAIMLLALALYISIWWFVYRRRSSFAVATRTEGPRGAYAFNKTNGPPLAPPAPSPSESVTANPPVRASSGPGRPTEGAVCSEFTLPLQGYDSSGADFQEREKAINTRTERISRWIHARHPGMINSVSTLKTQSQSQLLIPQTSPDPPSTHPFVVTKHSKTPELSLPTFPPSCLPPSPKPKYHSECPKVQKSFSVSTDQTPETAMSSPFLEDGQISGHRFHEHAKSVSSTGARTKSSIDTVPWRISLARRPPQVKWPFFDVSSSPVQSSTSASTSTASEEFADSCPQYRSLGPKAMRPFKVCVDHDKSQSSLPAAQSENGQDLSQQYLSKVTPPQDYLTLTNHRYGNMLGHSGSVHRSESTAKHSFGGSIDHIRNGAVSMPKYHNQCPKVKHTFQISVDSPQETRPGPSYHNQCPKVTKTVSISPSGPILPRTPSLTLRPEICCSETTIITAPKESPPSPIPGLPPPPWSLGAKEQRRKTFLLSRSTWSDSTTSRDSPSAADAANNAREIRRTLLLNTYPLAYFVLSLPWMVNCFMEAQGHTPHDSRVLHALLGLPQFLGFVNAIVFAVNESLKAMRRKARTAVMGQANEEKGSLDPERMRYRR